MAGALEAATGIAGFGTIKAFLPTGNGSDMVVTKPPDCGTGTAMILMAQAVDSATLLPCIESLPSGWDFGGADIEDDLAMFWLNAEDAGERAVTVTLTRDCPIEGEQVRIDGVESQPPDVALSEQPLPQSRSYVFDGGCATYALSAAAVSFVNDADAALGFIPRGAIVHSVAEDEDLTVCGAGAACPG